MRLIDEVNGLVEEVNRVADRVAVLEGCPLVAGKEKLVEELAWAINDTMDSDLDWSGVARKLIDAGWTKKGTGDE